MSDPARFIYGLDDVDSGVYRHLSDLLSTKVSQFYVEFLQQGGPKPHVVLHLNSNRPISIRRSQGEDLIIKGCLIGIDYVGSGLRGEFTIKLIPYRESSHAAKAAFQFPLVDTELRILDLIKVLRGTAQNLPNDHFTDLTRFDFVEATKTGDLDGCRDVITQWMIRLHASKKVKWTASGQGVGNITFRNLARHVPTNGFHHIIGNNYTTGPERDDSGRVYCSVTPLSLHRGTFRSGQVKRVEKYGEISLPYVRLDAAQATSPTAGQSHQRHDRDFGGQWDRHSVSHGGRDAGANTAHANTYWTPALNPIFPRDENRHTTASTTEGQSRHSAERNIGTPQQTQLVKGPDEKRLGLNDYRRLSYAKRTRENTTFTYEGHSIEGWQETKVDKRKARICPEKKLWVLEDDIT